MNKQVVIKVYIPTGVSVRVVTENIANLNKAGVDETPTISDVVMNKAFKMFDNGARIFDVRAKLNVTASQAQNLRRIYNGLKIDNNE
ncbi:hypothetical protein DSECCO2_119920 [anaerobic digester metagenome]